MTRTAKGKPLSARSLRLDEDVWGILQSLKGADGSINEALRSVLIESPPLLVSKPATTKLSKADQRVAEVAAADITARAVDRDDVAYDTDELPTQHITSVPAVQPSTKIDIDNLPDVKPVGMPRAQWEMLQRKKNPPPPPSWRLDTIAIAKPGVRK